MQKFSLVLTVVCCSWHAQAQPFAYDVFFNHTGYAIQRNQPSNAFHKVLVQPDGKIVCGGTVRPGGTPMPFIARFLANGLPDSSFASIGYTSFTTPFPIADIVDLEITSMALTADNKIIAACTQQPAFEGSIYILLRYNTNGTLDSSFNGTGIVTNTYTPDNAGELRGVLVQPDGKIVVSSYFNTNCQEFYLSRHNADGSIDYSFGNAGVAMVSPAPGCNNRSSNVAFTADGKIVLFGSIDPWSDNTGSFAFMRLHNNGSIDSSFGTNGIRIVDIHNVSEQSVKIIIQPDNKIIGCGYVTTGSLIETGFLTAKGVLVRLNADGSSDTGFGENGVSTNMINDPARTMFQDVIVDVNGMITTCSSWNYNNSHKLILVRYHPDGSTDESFGPGGIFVTAIAGTTGNNLDFSLAWGQNRLYSAGYAALNGGPTTGTVKAYITVGSTLPVSLRRFYGSQRSNGTNLFWEAGEQQNIDRYIVEKSIDGIRFNSIGTVALGNHSRYQFRDTFSLTGTCFYRLKMMDRAEGFNYSTILKFTGKSGSPVISIYPNPVKDELHVVLPAQGMYTALQIADTKGSIIKKVNGFTGAINSIAIDVHTLTPGVYYLVAQSSKGIQQQKFIKL